MIRFTTCIAILFLYVIPAAADDKPSKPKDAAAPNTAVAVKGTPKLDGQVDEIWKKTKAVKVQQSIVGLQQIGDDDMATATVKLMWDDKHIYALWNVKDPKLSDAGENPWDHDSVELFLDENKKGTFSYEQDDAQYRVDFKGQLSGQGAGFDVANLQAKTRQTKRGYIVEMAIKVNHAELKPGARLGLELQVNDNAGHGARGSVAKWVHAEDDSWEDTSQFGTLLVQ
ncbi:MAG: hypothetical protein HKN47_06685 [Pirellulaceae bacterium]|nr:hypothetical protein [Pirellulaceae bacterium]